MTPPAHRRAVCVAALAWGVAEATLFFIVPDVLLTRVALHDRRRALVGCGLAVLGAMLGGAVMYVWSLHDPAQVRAVLLRVPAVGPDLMTQAGEAMRQLGGFGIVAGAFQGVPYKLFAAQAAAADLSLPLLLAVTIPARGLRFVLTVLVAHAAAQWLRGRAGRRAVSLAWWLAWIIVYVVYWSRFGF